MDTPRVSLAHPLILIGVGACAIFILFAASLFWYGTWLDKREGRQWAISDGYCNIAVVPVQGDIVAYDGDSLYPTEDATTAPVATSGDWAERYIRDAEYDPTILGMLVQIDSYGGYAAPANQIKKALERSPLPSVAYIREMGTSGGYLAALGADYIVASPFASVGSIGVTYSYVQNVEQNKREGLEFIQLSSGDFKDYGNPNKPLTPEERALYERDVAVFADVFADLVAARRNLSDEEIKRVADGASMPASLALEHRLIDEVGDDDSVRAWFASELGISPEAIVFCK